MRTKINSRHITDDDVKYAKAWARTKGYRGDVGGIIRNPNGAAVCQGWRSFAALMAMPIQRDKERLR